MLYSKNLQKNLALLFTATTLTLVFNPINAFEIVCVAHRGQINFIIQTGKLNGEDRVFVRYANADGKRSFPFYEGVVTEATLPFLKIAQEDLAQIDQFLTASWPLSACQFSEANSFLMQCNGKGTFHQPLNAELETYTFSTSQYSEEKINQVFKINKFNWNIEGKGLQHMLVFPFNPDLCQVKK